MTYFDEPQPIAESNKGHQMLLKMGWKKDTAVGASGEGIVAPITLQGNAGSKGLGFGGEERRKKR